MFGAGTGRNRGAREMAYLPNFDEDVFISYAHNDDDVFTGEQWGWVSRLHQDLEQRVRNYLGTDVRFWRDCDIRNNDDFSKKIFNRLMRTATFLSVLSPSFLQREWCKRELESFTGHAESSIGILVDEERSRIFKVEKMPIERSALPPTMQGTKSYRFYQPDPSQPKRTIELRPLLGGEYLRRYFEEMDELAKDIAAMLKGMAQTPAAAARPGAAAAPAANADRPAVYVAETTSDLDDKLGELRRDLKDRGYLVLPDADLPYRAEGYKDKVRDCLKRAVLSVHLVGAGYGFVPEGETKSNVWLQHDLAMERGSDPNFLRLIWMPREVAAADQRQRDFIAYLQDDAGAQQGADLLNGNLEELKTVIHDRLAKIRRQRETARQQPAAAPATAAGPAAAAVSQRSPDEPLRVYIMCDAADRKSASLVGLRKYLLSEGFEPMLPMQAETEGEALQAHAENLGLCDGCVIFYGQGSPAWFEAKLRDLRKHLRGRQPPVAAKAIYIAQPSTEHKDEVETLEAAVLREDTAFASEVIAPFVQALGAVK
jgi:TIR domain